MMRQQQPSDPKWSVVKEWAGGETLEGVERAPESFARPAHSWRLEYKMEADTTPGRNGVVDIVVRTKADGLVKAVYNLQGPTSGFLTVKSEAPEFYLEVKSHGPKWWVAVEQSQ
jgi:hypothetical protein